MTAVAKSTILVQLESIMTGNPVSESALDSIAGAINYAIINSPKVGDLQWSDLDESTFQSDRDNTWWLCDGRSCLGTAYQDKTGLTSIPDRRGTYLRVPDHSRGLDPNGNQSIGTYIGDQFASHTHPIETTKNEANQNSGPAILGGVNGSETQINDSAQARGGSETAPKTTYANCFVKVNV